MLSISPERLRALENALHTDIPLTRVMEVRVLRFDQDGLTLGAALTPNLNHKNTAFGGSLNSLATLACWAMAQLLCTEDDSQGITVVIQDSEVQFLKPVTQDFQAVCPLPAPAIMQKFLHTLERKGRARLELTSYIYAKAELALRFSGQFVAYQRER